MMSEHNFHIESALELSNYYNSTGRDFIIISQDLNRIYSLINEFSKHKKIKAIYVSITKKINYMLYVGFTIQIDLGKYINCHEDLLILTNKYWNSMNCYTLMNLTGEFIEPDELNELIREEVRQQNLS